MLHRLIRGVKFSMSPDLNPVFLAELSAYIQQLMAEYDVPGVSVGLLTATASEVLTLGVNSLENPLPVTTQTLFQIGSITKTFTATLVMGLVEAGTLQLDVPVRTYLPDLKLADEDVAQRVTLRHLLTHTGGFRGDVFLNTGDGDDALSRVVAALAHEPQVTPLGAVWSYNNAGFYLAGRVIEVVRGQPFEAVMRERMLEPLGLSESFFFPAEVMTRRFAVGHVTQQGKLAVARPWNVPRSASPAGGLSCSVNDLMKYARFQLHGHPQMQPSPERLAEMQRPVTPISNTEDMGLSWFIQRVARPLTILHHGGRTSGQRASLWLIPECSAALVILTNAASGNPLKNALQTWLLEHWLGAPLPKREPFVPDPATYAEYAGQYRIPNAHSGDGFRLRVEGQHLLHISEDHDQAAEQVFVRGDTPPPVALTFSGPDEASIREGPLKGTSFIFLRAADGQVQYARSSNRVVPRVSD